jgi:hypothetical protein
MMDIQTNIPQSAEHRLSSESSLAPPAAINAIPVRRKTVDTSDIFAAIGLFFVAAPL